MEHENESLGKQIEDVQPSANDDLNALMSRDVKVELERKDGKIKQLSQDNDKLEAYSKQTLANFQEKFMVALQECKKQLKEKHEKIEDVQPGANDDLAALMSRDMKAELKRKDCKIKQLSQDKAKFEAYSKQTLVKFKEKYMVALQECKKQLKEKHEKIEQLDMRAAVEKAAQEREEKLVSSSMYELGLLILQNNSAQR